MDKSGPVEKFMFKKIGGAVVAVAPLSAFAEVPATVTSAITSAGADAVTVASAVLVVVVGLLGFRYMRREAK